MLTLVDTGVALLHAINERVANAWEEKGRPMPHSLRPALAIGVMLVAVYAATAVGLVDLIAKGYGTLTWWYFLAVYVLPLMTRGLWLLWRHHARGAALPSPTSRAPHSPVRFPRGHRDEHQVVDPVRRHRRRITGHGDGRGSHDAGRLRPAGRGGDAFARRSSMAIAVVQGGQIVHAKGYGVRRLGSPEAVDADTIFPTGSTGKAVTAAALAVLVDDGKLGWDDKVADHLPEFRMYDPWVTREMTVRDLLLHRSGPEAWARATCCSSRAPRAAAPTSSARCATSGRRPASAAATPTTTSCTSSPASW